MVSSVSVPQARKNGRINGSLDLLVSQNGVFHRQSLNLLSKGQIPELRQFKRSQFGSSSCQVFKMNWITNWLISKTTTDTSYRDVTRLGSVKDLAQSLDRVEEDVSLSHNGLVLCILKRWSVCLYDAVYPVNRTMKTTRSDEAG